MKIQLNTDANINGTEALAAKVSATIEQALDHFKDQITRVEVHISDESRGKTGLHDHRCMLEVRLEGLQPLAVTEHAETLDQAVDGASEKLEHLLDSKLGRMNDRRGKAPLPPLSEADVESEQDVE
jgi:ribosomal subunit interface protein